MSSKRLLCLVGSPRLKSTSEALARYMMNGLTERGWQAEIQRISPALRQPERWAQLESAFLSADVILLSCPLYVDSLPAETTLALERLAELRRAHPSKQAQQMLAVMQCGFFEAHQNDPGLAICRQFAREAGLAWCGGLGFGAGGTLGGKELKKSDGMTRFVTGALDLTIDAVDAGREVPAEAYATAEKSAFPAGLYFFIANLSMTIAALGNRSLLRVNAQPYQRSAG